VLIPAGEAKTVGARNLSGRKLIKYKRHGYFAQEARLFYQSAKWTTFARKLALGPTDQEITYLSFRRAA
jgi:hypothetical protein